MPSTKISALPEILTPAASDVVPVVNGGSTKKVQLQNIAGTGLGWVNVKSYGAVGNGAVDDSAAIQNAINAAAAVSSPVFLPAGTFMANGLVLPYNVPLIGSGIQHTILKSNAANALMTFTGTVSDEGGGQTFERISDIYFHGNSSGTIGLKLVNAGWFAISGCRFWYFTDAGVSMPGTLIGEFYGCDFRHNVVGARGSLAGGTFPPNLVSFRNCRLSFNSSRGLDWSAGSAVLLDACDLEHNGAANNTSAGIWFSGQYTAGNTGLFVTHTWMEFNNGLGQIYITPTQDDAVHVIRDCELSYPSGQHNIYINGVTYRSQTTIEGVAMGGTGVLDVFASGIKAQISVVGSQIPAVLSTGRVIESPSPDQAFVQKVGTLNAIEIPGLTTTQKNALTPGAGFLLFDQTTGKLNFYNGNAWEELGAGYASSWWQVAGAGGKGLMAYAAKGAGSYAASKVNLVSPGTHDLTDGSAPTWNGATGWSLDGTQWLVSDYVPVGTDFTFLIRIANGVYVNPYYGLGGTYRDAAPVGAFAIQVVTGAGMYCYNSSSLDNSHIITRNNPPPITAGVYGFSGLINYRNGAIESFSMESSPGTNDAIFIGALNYNNASAIQKFVGDILAAGLWTPALTPQQTMAVSSAMAAL